MNRTSTSVTGVLLLWVFFSAIPAKTYIDSGKIDLTCLLAPSPADTSQQAKDDKAEVFARQFHRTKLQEEYANADTTLSVFRFATILGRKFNKDSVPFTALLFTDAVNDAKKVIDPAKVFWSRPRPNTIPGSKPCVHVPESGSYPSGHSTIGNLMAILLANMLPEKKTELFNRGREFAENRVIGGAHFPSDIEAGRIAAAVIAFKLFENEDFKKDFEKSKIEVRKMCLPVAKKQK